MGMMDEWQGNGCTCDNCGVPCDEVAWEENAYCENCGLPLRESGA